LTQPQNSFLSQLVSIHSSSQALSKLAINRFQNLITQS
jgi:hypothetical protein